MVVRLLCVPAGLGAAFWANPACAGLGNSFFQNVYLQGFPSYYMWGIPSGIHDVQITTLAGTALNVSLGSVVMESLTVKNGVTYSIGNSIWDTSSRTLTLGNSTGFINVQDGVINDLISVSGTGSGLSILGPNQGSGTGALGLVLASSGNFNVGAGLTLSISSIISGVGISFTNTGLGLVILAGANTFSGNVTIKAGTVALSSGGSISNAPKVSIFDGGTFDVSAADFSFSGFNPIQTLAGGSSSGIATINAMSKTVSLNSGALLSFRAAGGPSNTVGKISVAGNLALNNNTVVVNVTGAALKVGTYRLLDCTGMLTGLVNSIPTLTGTALDSGYTAAITTTNGAGGHVDLVVNPVVKKIPTFSGLSSRTNRYDGPSLIFTGKLSTSDSIYPALGETIVVTIEGISFSTTINSATGDFSFSTGSVLFNASSNAYPIGYSYAGNQILSSATDTSTTLTVNQVPITFTLSYPRGNNKVYDGTVPVPFIGNAALVGAVNLNIVTFDDPSTRMLTLSFATPAVGTNKPITLGGFTISSWAVPNYFFVQPTSVLGDITPAPLNITANPDSKTYGDIRTYGAGSTSFASSGLQNGESIGMVTISAAGGGTLATDMVGNYTLMPSAATGGTFDTNNYSITYNSGTLTVIPAPLNIIANDAYKNLYDTLTFVGTEFTSVGLRNNETVGSVTLNSSGASPDATSGDYPIVPAAVMGGNFNPTNYSIAYSNGTLHVYLFTTNAVQTVTTFSNAPVQVKLADVLSKTVGGLGTLLFSSAFGASHGLLSADATNITYAPDADYLGDDSFQCIVIDGNGLSTAVTVLVSMVEQISTGNEGKLAVRSDGTGGMLVNVMGKPGTNYLLQYSADLKTWDAFLDFPAFEMPEAGVTNYDDSSGASQRYYRVVLP